MKLAPTSLPRASGPSFSLGFLLHSQMTRSYPQPGVGTEQVGGAAECPRGQAPLPVPNKVGQIMSQRRGQQAPQGRANQCCTNHVQRESGAAATVLYLVHRSRWFDMACINLTLHMIDPLNSSGPKALKDLQVDDLDNLVCLVNLLGRPYGAPIGGVPKHPREQA